MAPSTYYHTKTRPPSARACRDAVLGPALRQLWEDNYRVYGVRKLWRAARRAGHDVGRDHVARLMRHAGIEGARRGKKVQDHEAGRQRCAAPRSGEAQVRRDRAKPALGYDLTFVPTWAGVAYVCFIVDAHSRMIVGWRVDAHMHTSMVLDALEMARWSRGNTLPGLTCHSDAGSQFTSVRYGERLAEIGAVPSIGSIGDSFDNALAQTVKGYYKAELIYGPARSGPWKTVEDVKLATLGWVYWHNTSRFTAISATFRRPTSKPRSTMHNGATNPWSKSNSPSLRQTQSVSCRQLISIQFPLTHDPDQLGSRPRRQPFASPDSLGVQRSKEGRRDRCERKPAQQGRLLRHGATPETLNRSPTARQRRGCNGKTATGRLITQRWQRQPSARASCGSWQTHQLITAARLVESLQREVEGDRLGRFYQDDSLPVVPPVSQDMRRQTGQT